MALLLKQYYITTILHFQVNDIAKIQDAVSFGKSYSEK